MPICNLMAPTNPTQKRCGNCRHVSRIRRNGICGYAQYDSVADAIWNRGDVKCGKWESDEKPDIWEGKTDEEIEEIEAAYADHTS
jgi:hypothetical protein